MNENELMALTVVVNAMQLQRAAANATRLDQGHALAYDDEVPWAELDALHTELRRRRVLETEEPKPEPVVEKLAWVGCVDGGAMAPSGLGLYEVIPLSDPHRGWTALLARARICQGTLPECLAACEAREQKVEEPKPEPEEASEEASEVVVIWKGKAQEYP